MRIASSLPMSPTDSDLAIYSVRPYTRPTRPPPVNIEPVSPAPLPPQVGGLENDRLVGGADADILRGGGRHDTLIGRGGSDLLNGGPGHDRLAGGLGNDEIYGGAGKDTAVYGGRREDFDVVRTEPNTVVVTDRRNQATDTLHGVERLKFGDGTALNLENLSVTSDPGFKPAAENEPQGSKVR